jgi:hypothetical protein
VARPNRDNGTCAIVIGRFSVGSYWKKDPLIDRAVAYVVNSVIESRYHLMLTCIPHGSSPVGNIKAASQLNLAVHTVGSC